MDKFLKVLLQGALIFVVILGILLTAVFLNSCGASSQGVKKYDYERMKRIEVYEDMSVYVDTETGIAYGSWNSYSTIFPLYDSSGEHYRPNGWRDYG